MKGLFGRGRVTVNSTNNPPSPQTQDNRGTVDDKEQLLRKEQEKRREYAAKQEQLQNMFSGLDQLHISNALVEYNGDVEKAVDHLLNIQEIETQRTKARATRAQQQAAEERSDRDHYTPPGQVFRAEPSRPTSAVAFNDQIPVETQLLEAARESNVEKIKHFFNIRSTQFPGREFTPLYHKCLITSITSRSMEAVELFLQAGVSPDGPSDTTQTLSPLGLALQCNFPEAATLMLEKYRANPNKMNGPRSPLHMAVFATQYAVVVLLLEKGANINATELDSGRTALHMAIAVSSLDLVELLLVKNINVSIRDFTGETALHYAFRTNKTARDQIVLNLLIQHIKEQPELVNMQNSRTGDTILHIAVAKGIKLTQTIELVLQCRPDPRIANNVGKTPVDLARESPSENVIALILSYDESYVPPLPKDVLNVANSPPMTASPSTQRKHQFMPVADLGKEDAEESESPQQLPTTTTLSTPDPDWLAVSQFKDRLERNMGQFESEYEELEASSTDQILNGDFSSSLTKINLPKNRYRNILPLERTRVHLLSLEGVESSDYVNANYVGADLRGDRAYIVTQGPLDSTTPDFWRMVWEQNVSIIVMLSTFVEDGKSKVFPYFPQDHNDMDAGFFVVTLLTIQDETQLILRQFSIKLRHTGETRFVSHLQYVAWPDQGLPKDTKGFRTIIDEADRLNVSNGPTVVHCSAGIGRSGVFCVVHSIITKLKALLCASFDTTFHIQETLIRMRMDRIALVQNKEQYVFCCLALRDTLEEYLRILAYKNESWFHRTSNYTQASQTLAKSAFGTFMFVPSSEPGCLTLAYVSRDNNQLVTKKHEIFVSDAGFELGGELFPNLTALVHSQPAEFLRPYAARNKYKVKTANPPTMNH